MKISEGFRPIADMGKASDMRKTSETGKAAFAEVIREEEQRMSRDQLIKLFNDIDKQGQILARSRSIRDFYRYKQLIKEFMEEAVKYGMALDYRSGTNRRGQSKLYKMIKEVDAQLLRLADEIVDVHSPIIDMLGRIGEIRGMLINMYF